MQQVNEITPKSQDAMHLARRSQRQARVGIIANPVEIAKPVVVPREVWSRWPKLRSARRPRREKTEVAMAKDPVDTVLTGDKLRAYADDMRSGRLNARMAVEVSQPLAQDFTPPALRMRAVVRIALAVFLVGILLIGLALLIG